MMAEAARHREVIGLCFVLDVDISTAERLLDVHAVDYTRVLEGGDEFRRAKSLVAG